MYDNIKKWAHDNKYELMTELPKNWDRYGDGVPSVTTILSLLREPGFEYVKKMYPNEVQAACDRGTKVHGDAEDFFDGNSPVIHNRIMKFHVLCDVEIIHKELNVRNKGFQGTIDLVCDMSSPRFPMMACRGMANIDYKSSKKKSKKYFLQMSGYKDLNGNDGAVLYLDSKGFELLWAPKEYDILWAELRDYFLNLLKEGQ